LADAVDAVDQAIPFHGLSCAALAFSYRDEHGRPSFSLQPFDFRLSKGELVSSRAVTEAANRLFSKYSPDSIHLRMEILLLTA
jgi:hypothetical protein